MPRTQQLLRRATFAGTVPVRRRIGPVIVATDASHDEERAAGGYLATSGHYGGRAHPYPAEVTGPDRTTIIELRAVYLGLVAVLAEVQFAQRVTVLTDSTPALRHLTAWQGGDETMPYGYNTRPRRAGRPSTLESLQTLVAYTPGLCFRHVAGHKGHPLNEAADRLARLAFAACRGRVAREAATAGAAALARDRLREFNARP